MLINTNVIVPPFARACGLTNKDTDSDSDSLQADTTCGGGGRGEGGRDGEKAGGSYVFRDHCVDSQKILKAPVRRFSCNVSFPYELLFSDI